MNYRYILLECSTNGVTHGESVLQTTVEGLKEQAKEMDKNHQDQLVKLRIKLTKELEDSWKERLK